MNSVTKVTSNYCVKINNKAKVYLLNPWITSKPWQSATRDYFHLLRMAIPNVANVSSGASPAVISTTAAPQTGTFRCFHHSASFILNILSMNMILEKITNCGLFI